jgi:DNA-binding transcriptional ArsR family regulator
MVMLIDADNQGCGWIPLEAAVRSRRPFAIAVRDEVLAVDCDQPRLLPKLVDLAAALRRDGLRPVVLRSGRPGHAHLWCQIAVPALLADHKRRARELGFDVRDRHNLCRAPMSPHRRGHPVAVLGAQPETRHWQAALEEIGREQRRRWIEGTWRKLTNDPTWSLPGCTPAAAGAPLKAARKRRRPLGRQWERLIHDGVPQGRRHQVIQSVALAAVNAGWTEADFFSLIINNKLGEKAREQGGESARRKYIAAAWRKAVTRATEHPPTPGGPQVQAEVARLRQAVAAYPWKPRSGTTDRHVLEEHLRIVERTGRLEHDANVRDLAVAVGVDWSTVSRAHDRLRKSGWLVLVAGAEQRGFSTSAGWQVSCPGLKDCAISATHTSTAGVHETYVALIAQPHDVFRRRGLGKDTFRVWSHLDALAPVKATVLAKMLNRTRRTAYYHLEKLQAHGLAVKSPSGWLRAGAATLDAVAEERGVAGVGAAQKIRHRLDRRTRKERRQMMLNGTGTGSVEKEAI